MQRNVKRLILVFGMAGAVAAAPARASFCERLATEIGMKPAKSAASTKIWKRQTLNFGQTFLIGGTSVVQLSLKGYIPPANDDPVKLTSGCEMAAKGAHCLIVGPAQFHIAFKNINVNMPVYTEDHAEVRTVNTVIQCEEH
jgi:hypothetical protein